MTPQERAQLFANLFRLLDSDQPGERATALDKILALREKMQWPTFGDLLTQLESTITPEQYDALEQNLAQWVQAHDERVAENTTLAERINGLTALNRALRSTLWLSLNSGNLAALIVVIALGYGGYRWFGGSVSASAAPPAPVVVTPPPAKPAKPAETIAADDSERAATNAGLRDVLNRARWGKGDTAPAIVRIAGVDYWIMVRGTVDESSHADARGRPIERHCLQLFARQADADAGAYLTPNPYGPFGLWTKWSERASECRMPGRSNY